MKLTNVWVVLNDTRTMGIIPHVFTTKTEARKCFRQLVESYLRYDSDEEWLTEDDKIDVKEAVENNSWTDFEDRNSVILIEPD